MILFTISNISILASDLSVPAEYISQLRLPGTANQFLRPGRVYFDSYNQEMFVADPGNNRVVIFDKANVYRFEFSGLDQFSMPLDLAVNSEGYIYILGSASEGRKLLKYDFDGLYLESLDLRSLADDEEAGGIQSLAIDQSDNLYLLDVEKLEITVIDPNGSLIRRFSVAADVKDDLRRELILGSLYIKGDLLYIPASSFATVYIYTLEGHPVRTIGYRGNNVGELNFPVSVAVTSDGIVAVLDKHRYNIVCYSPTGKFLGEFGGKGSSFGWFYHPTWITIDQNDDIYIGQIYLNRVQKCALPAFIRERLVNLSSQSFKSIEKQQTVTLSVLPEEVVGK